jgi:histidinol-phosphatase
VRPGDGFLGEEFGDDSSSEAMRWIVDPIDGTKNFVRGIPVWGTLLALERHGRVELSVVSAPALGRRWWAILGEGAWANGEPCRVSAVTGVADSVISTTSPSEMPSSWHELSNRAWATRGLSDFWQHCLVAEGALDIATDSVVNLWDYAAIKLLVEEAGGRCTTFAGHEPAHGSSFISSNGAVHGEALDCLGTAA